MRRARARGPFKAPFLSALSIINPNGAIAGWYIDSAFVSHGFLRDRNGAFTTFDVPGAGRSRPGHVSASQSAKVERSQDFTLTDPANHGFLRDKKGVITTYDVPGAGTGPGQGTLGGGLTPSGAIMGNYLDADDLSHGFMMDRRLAPSRRSIRRTPVTSQVLTRYLPFWNQYQWSDHGILH